MERHGKRKRDDCDDASDAGSGCLVGVGDRLGALPDCLLHEIMSHLKARQVVQTCVLSRRWRHLWRSVPCLDVDQQEFKAAVAGYLGDREAWDKFEDFTVMLLKQVSIALLDTFRLHVKPYYSFAENKRSASGWIRREIKYGAHELGIAARDGFRSRPWRLRKLFLSNISQLDGLFAELVRSGCPSLEHLELENCSCEFHAITSGSLKKLVVKGCSSKELSVITSPTLKIMVFYCGSIRCPFVVTAPAVTYLSLVLSPYNFEGGVTVSEMASIAKAWIRLGVEGHKLKGDLVKILRSVSNATTLELSGLSDLTVPGEESTTFPEFKNLRTLELNGCNLSNDIQVSAYVLRNSPNVEKLTLSPSCWKALGQGSFSYPEFKKMRVLILDNYDPSDLPPLGRFLRSSPILEKLTLRCCKSSNDTKKKKGTSKMNNVEDLNDVRCESLRLTEIIYRGENVRQLLDFFLRRNLPNNCIKFPIAD